VSSRKQKQRLQDLQSCVQEAIQFVADMDYEAFRADARTINAVLYDLAVIGEIAASLLPEIATEYPNLPWQEMRAMRNIAIHEYFRVNLQIVWTTLQEDLPPLVKQLQEIV
jgi:uncharacterized protein with HEPN domain